MEEPRSGSVKDVVDYRDTTITWWFTDRVSAFDKGAHPQEIPGKGEAICACAVKSFEIAEAIGVPTHFLRQIDERTIMVERLEVLTEYTSLSKNCVIPVEWIIRNRLSKKLRTAFKDGKEFPSKYGFPNDDIPEEGVLFPVPIHEFTTKFEDEDRKIPPEEAMAMAGLSESDTTDAWTLIDNLNGALGLGFQQAGFMNFDGKFELGFGPNRELMAIDVMGTPDENRPVLAYAFENGHIDHYGKEWLRQYLIEIGYYAKLQYARKNGESLPAYPELPMDVIDELSGRYRAFADGYSNVKIIG